MRGPYSQMLSKRSYWAVEPRSPILDSLGPTRKTMGRYLWRMGTAIGMDRGNTQNVECTFNMDKYGAAGRSMLFPVSRLSS